MDFGAESPLMAVGHQGEGLHMAQSAHPYRTQFDHPSEFRRVPTAVDRSRYFEPAHTAETGPIHHTARSHREILERSHDIEAMNPEHIFHSAE